MVDLITKATELSIAKQNVKITIAKTVTARAEAFTPGTILNDTIYIKKNNLNTHYKNLSISANVNLASINSKLSMNRRGTGMNLNCLYDFSCKDFVFS